MTLFALFLGWVAEIAIEPSFDSPLWEWLATGAVLIAGGLFAVRGRARWALLTVAAFAFGAARIRATDPVPGPSFIGFYVAPQHQITLGGRVAGDPMVRPDGLDFLLVVDRLLNPAGEVVARHKVLRVAAPEGVADASPSAAAFLHACAERAVPVITIRPGARFDLGAGAALIVLDETDRGFLIQLEYGRARFVLPLGVDPDLLETRVDRGYISEAQVLMLGEGGYSAVNPPAWIAAVDPWLVLLSTGLQASSRSSLEVLRSLQPRLLLRTDVHGWVDIATDGERLWLRSER